MKILEQECVLLVSAKSPDGILSQVYENIARDKKHTLFFGRNKNGKFLEKISICLPCAEKTVENFKNFLEDTYMNQVKIDFVGYNIKCKFIKEENLLKFLDELRGEDLVVNRLNQQTLKLGIPKTKYDLILSFLKK